MRSNSRFVLVLAGTAFALIGLGCSDSTTDGQNPATGSGGHTAAGQGGSQGKGGTSGSGGSVGTGGSQGTGGAQDAGGVQGTGGRGNGGAPGTGGRGTGGAQGSGGQQGTGGAQGTGGQAGTGGTAGGPGRDGGSGREGGVPPAGTGGSAAGGTTGSGTGGATGGAGGGGAVKSAGCGKTPTLKSGTNTLSGRQYILRIPSNYDNNKAYRLIFGFHWLGGTMTDVDTGQTVTRNVWSYYGLQQLDTEKTAIFVAPQGNGNGWGNPGGADTTFVDNMVKAFEDDLCIDTRQIFSVGFSYGGGMSYALACARAKVFRGVAIYDGGVLSGCTGGNDPIAYFQSHGVSDGVLGYSGAESMRDRFVKNNGCTAQKPPAVKAGSQTHITTDFAGCQAGYPVEWVSFDGGHDASPCDGSCINAPADTKGRQTYLPSMTWKLWTSLPQ